MTRLIQITPFILCADLKRAIRFYGEKLGFDLGFQADNYAFMRRDGAAIRLLETDLDLHDPRRQNSVYIDVDDIDALWADIGPKLADLPKGRVRAPFNQDYNQREFHVIDEDCTLLFFGAPVTSGDSPA